MKKNNSAAPPTVLLVLGMHRSGTSAITRVLNLLGVPLGRDLLQPQDDNNKGFWEHARAVAINEKLLGALNHKWHDVREMPVGWMEHPAAIEAREEIAALVRSELAPDGLWAVKDPRICRLAPLWLSVLAQEGIEAKVVLMVRDPREVALSLQRRDGWTLAHSYLMWAQHFIEASEASSGVRRVLATYDELLTDWRGTMRRVGLELGIQWPRGEDQVGTDIDDFISPADRHHRVENAALPATIESTPLPPLLGSLFESAISVAAGRLEWSALEDMRVAYREAVAIFALPVAELTAERNELERLALERMDHIYGLVTAKEIVERRETALGEQLAQKGREVEEAAAKLHASVGEIEKTQGLLRTSEADLERLQASLLEHLERRSALEAHIQQQDFQIEGLSLDQRELTTLKGALKQEKEYIERAFLMSDRVESELRARLQEKDAQLREQEGLAATVTRLAESNALLEARVQEERAEVQGLQEQMEHLVAELQARNGEIEAEKSLLQSGLETAVHANEELERELAAVREAQAALEERVESLQGRLGHANDQVSRTRWLLGRAWRNVIGLEPRDGL